MKYGVPCLLGLLAFTACTGKATQLGSGSGGAIGAGGVAGSAGATGAGGRINTGGAAGSGAATGTAGGIGTGGTIGTGAVVGSGGATGSGGKIGTGGVAGTGGILATGGTTGMGGVVGSGGATGSGGKIGTGGVAGTGGILATGGATGTGGLVGSGGATGSGGRIGTGGVAGTGGILATGGAIGTGGTTGSGGVLSTGGTRQACIPACTAGQDCVDGACLLHLGGTCSLTTDCPSSARCCDGTDQTCDGTRLPAGDSTNSGQFVVSPDGLTVTDTITGLVWQRDGSGTRTGCSADDTCVWAAAKAYCAGLVLGGVSGWRLPSRMELLTIVDYTDTNPSKIDSTAFPDTPGVSYWTSSPHAGVYTEAWSVDFFKGGSGYDGVSLGRWVRCVR